MLSNSHQVDGFNFYFEEMRALLREVGFTHVYQLKSDGFVKVSL